MEKFISSIQAIKLIKDNDYIIIGSSGYWTVAHGILKQLNKYYCLNNHPKNLTLFSGISGGNLTKEKSYFNYLAENGLLKRCISCHYGLSREFSDAASNNIYASYSLALGTYIDLLLAISKKEDYFITKRGINTFLDPRFGGSINNEKAKKDNFNLVKLITINNKDYLLYKTHKIDICFIKASKCDNNGNISFEDEPFIGEEKEIITATKACGGIVVCEVSLKENKTFKHNKIDIHNTLIDYIYINNCNKYNETFTSIKGNKIITKNEISKLDLCEKKVICKRALEELNKNEIVNLGVGIPALIPNVALEKYGKIDFLSSIEMGALGGDACGKELFGGAINPEVIYDTTFKIRLYNGGFLNKTILGMAQVDKLGNVNVSKFSNKIIGPGGFIDITQNTKNIIFVGTFLTSSNVEIKNKSLNIISNEGISKFKNEIDQMTFSSKYALENNCNVLYITERAVFRLTKKGLELIEIAPGVDLKKDILLNMEFKPLINKNIKIMNKEIFK